MAEEKIGSLLDSLGVVAEFGEGDMVTDAVIVLKVVGPDGDVGIGVANSQGCSWLEQLGLITAADQLIRSSRIFRVGGDEC